MLLNDDAESGSGDSTAERIAAKGASVISGFVDAQDLARCENGRDGVEATGESLADDQDIGRDFLVHVSEKFACAAEAGLNFVEHEKDARFAADIGSFAEKSVGRYDDAGFTLYRFDKERACIRSDGFAQSRAVAERNDPEAGSEWAESVAILGVAGKANGGDGASVEIAGADDDLSFVFRDTLEFVAPLACGFDRCFNRFGSGVHGQGHVEASKVVKIFVEQGQLFVAKSAGGQRNFRSLRMEGPENFWVAMPLVDSGVGSKAIKVALSIDVIDPDALGALNDYIEWVVVVSAVTIFQVDKFLSARELI